MNEIAVVSYQMQDKLLQEEVQSLKIQVRDQKSNPLTTTRWEEMQHVHEMIKGMSRKDVDRVTNSIQKRIYDEQYIMYTSKMEEDLRMALA